MKKFKSVDELVNQLKPSNPVYCIRKHTLEKASKFFQKNFKSKIFYAVKTNPNEFILKTLFNSGINMLFSIDNGLPVSQRTAPFMVLGILKFRLIIIKFFSNF